LPATPQMKFSHSFPGAIWATLAVPERHLLIIEERDQTNFQVKFSALDFQTDTFLWRGLTLKESWWIGLTAANNNTVLLHSYTNKGNPDHKNLIALDILTGKIRWEVEEFSFFDWDGSEIVGHLTKNELVQASINIQSGLVTERAWDEKPADNRTTPLQPVRYLEGTPYFETVKEFMEKGTTYHPIKGVEYLEWNDLIMISLYEEENGNLANYLIVFDKNGEVLLEVKLGGKLSGLGTDTFFILSGCLFLIKNKTELVAYTFYD
jgi:outer membrane protein assembly factor BamB